MPSTIETKSILKTNNFGCIILLQSITELFFSRIEIGNVGLVMLLVMELKLTGNKFSFHCNSILLARQTSIISAQIIGSSAL